MNDKQVPRSADENSDSGYRSRWAVSPGSIDDGFGRRQPEGDDAAPRLRSAREIIEEVTAGRRASDEAPTRVTIRRPDVPFEVRPRPHLDPKGYDRPSAADDRAGPTRQSRLADEASRVTPDLGERRELTPVSAGGNSRAVMAGFGGVILIAIGGLLGAILDYLFTDRIGIITAVGLALGAVIAALITRKRDLLSIIVAPPLVYAVLATLVLLLSAKPIRVTSIADAAIRGFPAMALAAGLAAIIAGVRLMTSKTGERR